MNLFMGVGLVGSGLDGSDGSTDRLDTGFGGRTEGMSLHLDGAG
jgi:hypothetical protein